MAHLLLCRHCTRYFKQLAPACPFCATAPLTREPPPVLALPKRASRSAIHAARMAVLVSTTFVACTDGKQPQNEVSDGQSTDTSDTGDTSDSTNTSNTGEVMGKSGEACPGHTPLDSTQARCHSDADCSAGSVCSTHPVQVLPDRGQCRFMESCSPVVCDGECLPSPSGCGLTCVSRCSELNCSGVSECVDNQCLPKRCDVEGSLGCRAGYACAPGEANADIEGCVIVPCDQEGGQVCLEGQRCAPEHERAFPSGCVVLLCDEEGAAPCPQYYECAPEAPEATSVGCAQLSCSQPGGIVCPIGTKCAPDAEHATQTGTYAGCATILCDQAEGPTCMADYTCNPGATDALGTGCAPASCQAGWSCDPWRSCNPATEGADLHGCADQPCTTDTDCGCGFCFNEVCVPVEPTCYVPEIIATPYGCVWPDDEFV